MAIRVQQITGGIHPELGGLRFPWVGLGKSAQGQPRHAACMVSTRYPDVGPTRVSNSLGVGRTYIQ